MKIGFYLGSFDPIHIGHINVIRCVLNSKVVDKIIVVPALKNPWKYIEPAPFDDRLKMIQMSIQPFGDKCEVSDIEKSNNTHYSYETCQLLKEQYKNDILFIIGGSDVASTISKWKNYDEVISPNFGLIAVNRVNGDSPKHIFWEGRNHVSIVDNALDVSSTYVRQLLKTNTPVYPLIPLNVENYIKSNNLYG